MIAKLIKICKFLLKTKIIFQKPKYSDVIVLDSTSIEDIKNILVDYKWNAVETRNELIKNLYITPYIAIRFFFNLKDNIKIAYLISLIETINPKVVLTFIDNSSHFSNVAKNIKNKKIIFLAIQNAWRGDMSEHDYFYKKGLLKSNPNKHLFLPNFFCHGENDVKKYKKYKIKVKKFHKIGSFRLYNAVQQKVKKSNFFFDICLVSNTTWTRELTSSDTTFVTSYVKLVNYAIKFVREKKLKFIFCLKNSNRSISFQNKEISILKRYLKKGDFNFLKKNSTFNKKEKFSSYNKAFNSKVIVGQTSTLLGECLGFGKKVFSCNFSNLSYCDFPVKGISFLKKGSYKDFKKKLNIILNCSDSYYQKNLNQNKNYIVNYNSKINPNSVVKDFIDKVLNLNKED
jgi:surface carbohydrate biosynthesis protein